MEKRRETSAFHRERAARDVDVELPTAEVFAGGDDFKQAIARRDAAQARRDAQRGVNRASQQAEIASRVAAAQSKEQATIAMFREMAKNCQLKK